MRPPHHSGSESPFQFGEFQLDPARGTLLFRGSPVKLQPQPYKVLHCLLTHAPAIVSREQLGEFVWGERGVHVELEQSLGYCIRQIRQVLGDSATDPLYIETLPRQGYRFIGKLNSALSPMPAEAPPPTDVSSQPLARIPLPASAESPSPPSQSHSPFRRWRYLLAAALLLSAVAVWAAVERHRSTAQPRIASIAVLPLENLSGDPAQEYFADGMTDELITQLVRVPGLRVVSRSSAMLERGRSKTIKQIADELGVQAIVEGSVLRLNDQIRITVHLIDAQTDRNLWAQTFEGHASDALKLEDGVAAEIASNTSLALLPNANIAPRSLRTVDPVAYDAYLHGLYFYDRRDALRSATYFQKVIDAEPEFAPGYVGMANASESKYAFELSPLQGVLKGEAYARKAIQLDPANAEAYIVLGSLQQITWDFAAASISLKKGLELNQNSSLGHMKYASFLDSTGHPEDAIAHMKRSVQLDPLSFFMNRHLGTTLYFGRHYDEAIEQLQRAAEIEPSLSSVTENWISHAYEKKGMQAQAVDHDLLSLHLPPQQNTALRAIYRTQGWNPYWEARVKDTYAQYPQCTEYMYAEKATRARDYNSAFTHLNLAVDQHCFWMMWIAVDPMFEDLWPDPRFPQVVARIKPGQQTPVQ